MRRPSTSRYKHHRFPAEIISRGVWLCFRLSYLDEVCPVKPGTVLYISKGIPHGIKAEGGELTLIDFAQPAFDPNKMEWVK